MQRTLRMISSCLLAVLTLFSLVPAAHAVTSCTQTGCDKEVEVIMTPPSCTTPGSIEYDCPDCGRYPVSTTPAQHKFDVLEDSRTEPTCEKEGSQVKKCAVCGERETEKIPALGHEVTAVPAASETCTEPGRRAHWRCTRSGCGSLFEDEQAKRKITESSLVIPAAGHTLIRHSGEPATCLEAGILEHWTCSVCGGTFRDSSGKTILSSTISPAPGHDLTEVPAEAATGSGPGNIAHFRCGRCGRLFLDADGLHEAQEQDILVPPGALLGGTAACTNPLCEEPVQIITLPASCTEDGRTEYVCPVHGRYEVSVLPAAHDLRHVPEVPATTETSGTREYWECRRCGARFLDADGTRPAADADLRLPKLDPIPVLDLDASTLSLDGGGLLVSIHLTDLAPSRSYTLRAALADAGTGNEMSFAGCTAEAEIQPASSAETVTLRFDADLLDLRGRAAAARAALLGKDGETLASGSLSASPLHIPDPAIVLSDLSADVPAYADGEAILAAAFDLSGLLPGEEYCLLGTLQDMQTGKEILDADGEPISIRESFRPEKETSSISLTFRADPELLDGKALTVCAQLSRGRDGRTVAAAGSAENAKTLLFSASRRPSLTVTDLTADTPPYGDRSAAVTATLAYTALAPETEYKAEGWLVDPETGKEIRTGGERIQASRTFSPEKPEGTLELTFSVPADLLDGRKAAALGKITRVRDGRILAETEDPGSDSLSVSLMAPAAPTLAITDLSADIPPYGDGPAAIRASLAYTGLLPETEYKAEGWLVDPRTGEEIRTSGASIQASTTFTPEKPSGTLELAFSVPADVLDGRQAAALGKITRVRDGKILAETQDAGPDSPSVSLQAPAAPTLAAADLTADIPPYGEGPAILTATLAYAGLDPGSEYTAEAWLIDAQTGKEILAAGERISAGKNFSPENSSGTLELVFSVPADILDGRRAAVSGKIARLRDGRLMAETEHTEGGGPSVSLQAPASPGLCIRSAEAVVPADGSPASLAVLLAYEGLGPESGVRLRLRLEDAQTGNVLPVEAEEILTAASATKECTLPLPEELLGREVLLAAELRDSSGAHLLAEAEALRISIPERPEAADPAAIFLTELALLEPADADPLSIAATLRCAGLTAGQTYRLHAWLQDAASGERIQDGGEEVRTSADFQAEDPEGTLTLTFTLSRKAAAGRSLTAVAEILAADSTVLAKTEDLEAGTPVLAVPELPSAPEDPETAAVHSAQLSYADGVLTVLAAYRGLTPGETYEISGILTDRDSGRPVLAAGAEITASERFTPKQPDGTVLLAFSVPAEELAGRSVRAVLTIRSLDGEIVAESAEEDDTFLTLPELQEPEPSPSTSPTKIPEEDKGPEGTESPSASPEPSSDPTASAEPSPSPLETPTPSPSASPEGSPSTPAPSGSPTLTPVPEEDKGPSATPAPSSGLSPGTGDETNLWLPAIGLAAGIIVLILLLRERRRAR